MRNLIEAIRKINRLRKIKITGDKKEVKYEKGAIQRAVIYKGKGGHRVEAKLRSHVLVRQILFNPAAGSDENEFTFEFHKPKGNVNHIIINRNWRKAVEALGYSVESQLFHQLWQYAHISAGSKRVAILAARKVGGLEYVRWFNAHEAHVEPLVRTLFGSSLQLTSRKRKRK